VLERVLVQLTLWVLCLAGMMLTGCSLFSSGDLGVSPLANTEQFDFRANPTNQIAPEAITNAYCLGVGDVLAISVYGEEGSLRETPVDPNGNITYVLTGAVPAAGRTIDDLRTDVQKRVSAKLSRAIVNMVPVRFGSQTYTILGELNYPGTYLIEGRTTIIDAVAKARGVRTGYFRNSTAEMADYRHATLMRGGQVLPLDFEALLRQGDSTQNLTLRNGDIITIPSSLVKSIYVLGEVNFPRTVGFVSSVSLIQALTEAQGIKAASDGRIVIVRGSLSRPVVQVAHYDQMLAGKEPNLPLMPGDIIYVPPNRFAFLREVVEKAISAFATTIAQESAVRVYNNTLGTPAGTDSTRPVIVP
jgi:polysaccharide export outer membrane protein